MVITHEQLENLAFGDRQAALTDLVAGSPDHDYFLGVALIDQGAFDAADRLIASWSTRHGSQGLAQRDRLRARLALRSVAADPRGSRHFGVLRQICGLDDLPSGPTRTDTSLHDEAEMARPEACDPSTLDPESYALHTWMERADHLTSDLSDWGPSALFAFAAAADGASENGPISEDILNAAGPWLAAAGMSPIVLAAATDVDALHRHLDHLTHPQLLGIANAEPAWTNDPRWVDAMLNRLAPPADVDLATDMAARDALLERLDHFTSTLSTAFAPLRATVLLHRLRRAIERNDRDAIITTLKARLLIPDLADWRRPPPHTPPLRTPLPAVQLNACGLPDAPPPLQTLVREAFEHLLKSNPACDFSSFEGLVTSDWLAQTRAEIHLLRGATPESEAAAATLLGPTRVANLRDSVEIRFVGAPVQALERDAAVNLPIVVKNVPEVLVKVFRIDPVALYLADAPDITATIDLDGLGATFEMALSFPGPAIRRFDHQLELPMCAGPGVWVVELIGNGRASRAVIRKGTVRHTTLPGAAGLVVTPVDADGGPVADATLWVGKTAFKPSVPRSGGHPCFIVPFSEKGRPEKALLVDHSQGHIAQRIELAPPAERFSLSAEVLLDRQQIIAGAMATALVRPRLAIGNAEASVAILDETVVEIQATAVDGTIITSVEPVSFDDMAETAVSFRVPERTVDLAMTLRGVVPAGRGFQPVAVATTVRTSTAGIRSEPAIACLFMRRGPAGWLIELLGLGGEPLAGQDIELTLWHEDAPGELPETLTTDASGAVHLGDLDGIRSVRAKAAETERTFALDRSGTALTGFPETFHAAVGAVLTLPPVPAGTPVLLLEMRGRFPFDNQTNLVTRHDDHLRIGPLPSGDYQLLRGRLQPIRISVGGPARHGFARRGKSLLQLSTPAPFIAGHHIDTADDARLILGIRHAGPDTRVHVVATPRLGDPAFVGSLARQIPPPERHTFLAPVTEFISGREIGDEYRYILDRRKLPKRLGNLLTRPGILLNPWAVRTTHNRRQEARATESWRMPAAPPPPPAMASARAALAGAPMPYDSQRPTRRFDHAQAQDDGGQRPWECHDFIGEPPVVLTQLVPEPAGDGIHTISIPLGKLAAFGHLRVHVVDPAGSSFHDVATLFPPAPPRDLRLALALDPTGHFREERTLRTCQAGATMTVGDIRTGRIEVLATLGDVHRAISGIELSQGQSDFGTFAFVTRWHKLDGPTRLELLAQHACHELHLFLHAHDRTFFDDVVRPHLEQKFQKTFIDLWLLDGDLSAWDSPAARNDLNTFEWLLLARRRPALRASLARTLSEIVARQPKHDARDERLVKTVLGLDALSESFDDIHRSQDGGELGDAGLEAQMFEPEPEPAPKRKRSGKPPGRGALADDFAAREEHEERYRAPDATQEWAENNWWKRLSADSDLIGPNRFWRDLANHLAAADETPFLSAHLADVTGSFAEAMCALASLGLPFEKPTHISHRAGLSLTLTFIAPAIIGHLDIAPCDAEPTNDVLVGETFIRADDPTEFADGQPRDKTTEGPFMPGVVYRKRTVVSNPTGVQRTALVLLQVPRGAIAVGGHLPTRTERLTLKAYETVAIDSTFYFPTACTATHFPAHVQEGARTVGAARPLHGDGILAVTTETPPDARVAWPWVAAHAPDKAVLTHVDAANLSDLDLGLIRQRLNDPDFFAALVALLESRHFFDSDVWSFAFAHRDLDRMAAWLQAHPEVVGAAGPAFDGGPFAPAPTHPRHHARTQHLEYAPLIPARAHPLGQGRVITNDGLESTYRAFLDRVAHQRAPTPDDRLAWSQHLIALDRIEEANDVWNSIDSAAVSSPMAYAHVGAWLAVSRGDVAMAVSLAEPWRQHPALRWRTLFEAVIASARLEVPPEAADPRGAALTRLAATTPTLAFAIRDGYMELQHSGATEVTLAFYPIELELLFSRAPFMEADTARFQWISPWFTQTMTIAGETTSLTLPDACHGRNVVIVATMAGLRRTATHLASHLRVNVSERAGRLQVLDRRDQSPRPAAYVKVFARDATHRTFFYKDGYTDSLGRFDYTSLSTTELSEVARFAILVLDDTCGATVVECPPPIH